MNRCLYCGKETKNPKFCSIYCRSKFYSGDRNVAKRFEIKKFHKDNNPMKNPKIKEKHRKIMIEINSKTEINEKRSKSLIKYWSTANDRRNNASLNFLSNNPMNDINNREKISIKLKGTRCGIENHNYGKPPAKGAGSGKGSYYDSCLQGKIWLRSTYELAYAKYLDEHKILWMYEMETFDLGDTTYTPDFFLPQFEKFIEIKGWMRKEYQEKIDKFREQYPWDLEVLFKEDLVKLGVKL